MRTATIQILKFSELSANAKQRAKDDYANNHGYSWEDEALDSMKKLAEHFGGTVRNNYSIDWFGTTRSWMYFDMPDDMEPEEIRRRLDQLGTYDAETLKGHGDCALTGVCHDEDAIDGFRIAFLRGKTDPDLNKLMEAAFDSWLKACHADAADQYTDDTFGEHCEANDYEFYENGKFYVAKK